ncbi:hypothetical protein BV25DRAFT_1172574 [Artomyces pyxidatus]|uniref:Uncharacterized protein n=1 Tax=Artomyces pyxidatus TaxID=48021 RepID=A0ACB8SRL0_9AGAM|nr:hypothetical protein BV25DRAFT_1172574 [Artomyces pyxidatus]
MAPSFDAGAIVRCHESVHTPAVLALLNRTSPSTFDSSPTLRSADTYNGQKTRPCLIMPSWEPAKKASRSNPVQICVMGTFHGAKYHELAEVHQHFALPMFRHSDYDNDHPDHVSANVHWTTNAWLVAYPFVPRRPLMNQWMERGVPATVNEEELERLSTLSDTLIKEWQVKMRDVAEHRRVQANHEAVKQRVKVRKARRSSEAVPSPALPIVAIPQETQAGPDLAINDQTPGQSSSPASASFGTRRRSLQTDPRFWTQDDKRAQTQAEKPPDDRKSTAAGVGTEKKGLKQVVRAAKSYLSRGKKRRKA